MPVRPKAKTGAAPKGQRRLRLHTVLCFLVATAIASLLTACDSGRRSWSLRGQFKPTGVPLSVSVDTNGDISFHTDEFVQVPLGLLGTFSVSASLDPLHRYSDKKTLTVRMGGQDTVYDLLGEDYLVRFDSGYYEQVVLRSSDGSWLLELQTFASDGPVVTSEPSSWLPNEGEELDGLYVKHEFVTTNKYLAEFHDDPVRILTMYRQWGRREGFWRDYRTNRECEATDGVVLLVLNPALYHSADGARHGLAWGRKREVEERGSIVSESDLVGDQAFVYSAPNGIACYDPPEMDEAGITFTRWNTIVDVQALFVRGTVDRESQRGLVLGLARKIDLNIVTSEK